MKAAIVISAAVLLGLLGVLGWVGDGRRWPVAESPPGQGEALDPAALQLGRFEHTAASLGRLIREPQNTWSNLPLVFAGACLACLATLRTSRLAGVALIAVGVGSFVYHASASRTLRHLDVGAIYGLFVTLLALAIASLGPRSRAWAESRTGMLGAAAVAFAIWATINRNVVVWGTKPLGLSVVTAAASTVFIGSLLLLAWRRRSRRVTVSVGAGILLFLGAVVCQVGDRPHGWLLNPDAVFQAHALWHVLGALAIFLSVEAIDGDARPT